MKEQDRVVEAGRCPSTWGPRRRLTVAEVREHRGEIEAAARDHGVRAVRVFGSVARGDATERGDRDLLVDVEPATGMLRLTGFALAVEALLHVHTQLATPAGLKPRLRDSIPAEAISL